MVSRRSRVWIVLSTVIFCAAVGTTVFVLFLHPSISKKTTPQQMPQNEIGSTAGKMGAEDIPTAHTSHGEDVRLETVLEPIISQKVGILAKRTFSSSMRLIYLVGLEGTGHHYMADVMDELCKSVPCPKVCSLAHALYPGLGNPKSADAYLNARKEIRIQMDELAAAGRKLPEGKASMVGFGKCRFQTGMMSYPNFNGSLKALQYVDFKILAEEAERAGIDLRIIYLSRSARDILISDTKHNNYGNTFMLESRNLMVNADVVMSTFQELDPAFVTCFRYENISDPEQARRVADFAAPTEHISDRFMNGMLAAVRPKSKKKSRGSKGNAAMSDPTTAKGAVVARLQEKLDAIESHRCRF